LTRGTKHPGATFAGPDARSLRVIPALPRSFYARSPLVVARDLIGRVLVRHAGGELLAGIIVEVEAYAGERDPASHAWRGETPRNRVMFGAPGHAYIYVSYGMHHCLNVVTGRAGEASAVLVRALEPIAGLDRMAGRRGVDDPVRFMRGPGCVGQALGLTIAQNGTDLTRGPLRILDLPPERRGFAIARSPRIGIRRGIDRRWRWLLAGHPAVSGRALRVPQVR
jgi:DNA-3-methyladenine glycosylase